MVWFALRVLLLLAIGGLVLLGPFGVRAVASKTDQPLVYVLPLRGEINAGTAAFVQRTLGEAERERARLVVLDLNTFGGRLDAAVAIRDALLSTPVETVAFVNHRAISAGALIALATPRIAMTEGATIGAATPVTVTGGEQPPQTASEKTVSYVRKEFRATADARGHPGLVAEAMVDPDVVIPGVIDKGRLLTLTTNEALQIGVAETGAASLSDLLLKLNVPNARIDTAKRMWAEHLIGFLAHPVLSSLLLSLAMLGILIELRTPGFGIPGVVGIASLLLFFWGGAIGRLVGWEDIALIGVGIALLGLEFFVIPGFGIAGVLGVLALVSGFTLSLLGSGASVAAVTRAAAEVLIALLAALVTSAIFLHFLPSLPFGRRLVLSTGLTAGGGDMTGSEANRKWLIGRRGMTRTALRPSGLAQIDGERLEVTSDSGLVGPEEPVEVVAIERNRVLVRALRSNDTRERKE